ncbi:spartin-like [Babylonia areolata]|uniref:spartin-like n=1 Tax=Babylonia areolata TaxID=304850 RepID=UPI003FD36900
MECSGQRPAQRQTPPPRPPPPGSRAAQRSSATEEATAAFRDFQKLHDKAFASVQKGLNADEDGDITTALHYYSNSLPLLEQVLLTDLENLPGVTSSEEDSVKQMQQKMNKTKLQITYRIESLRSNEQPVSGLPEMSSNTDHPGVKLPSYEEAVSSSGHSSMISDAALGDSIMAAEYPGFGIRERSSTEGTELFSIADGVQIFYISREGYVSAPTYPTSLHIIKFQDSDQESSQVSSSAPPAFIQVGDWFYPLIPGASPVLHATYGAYLFPDLSPESAGASVGMMLPDTISPGEKQTLEDILKNLSLIQEQQTQIQPEDLVVPSAPLAEREEPTAPPAVSESQEGQQYRQGEPEQSTSAKISHGISVASKWISWGVGKGAEKAGELISYGSSKLQAKLRPEQQPKPVDPRVQTGMMYARKATHVGVTVSAFIVTKLGEATMALGRQIAPHIRKKGEKLLPKSVTTEKNKSTMDGVMEVAASGLHGFGTVYMSLEGAAKALARSLANETVATVQHKYGQEAGSLAENTVYAAGNIAMTAYNADNLGIKAIAKRAAKDTGKAMLQDIQEKKATSKQTDGACHDGSEWSSNKKGGKPPM